MQSYLNLWPSKMNSYSEGRKDVFTKKTMWKNVFEIYQYHRCVQLFEYILDIISSSIYILFYYHSILITNLLTCSKQMLTKYCNLRVSLNLKHFILKRRTWNNTIKYMMRNKDINGTERSSSQCFICSS